jgi:hypothetical protein
VDEFADGDVAQPESTSAMEAVSTDVRKAEIRIDMKNLT